MFICFLCQEAVALQPKHHCQKECLPITGMHRDFCEMRKAIVLKSMEKEGQSEGQDNPQ